MGRSIIRVARAFACVLALSLVVVAPAAAAPVGVSLTASNGEGTFDPTLPCPSGDGPSWRYAYSGPVSASTGGLAGLWRGTFEVHDANGGTAFVPEGTGRLRIGGVHGGEASAFLGQGGCNLAPLTLSTQVDGDPEVSGTLPFTVSGGTGPLRSVTGNGIAELTLELGPGADNVAEVNLDGDLTVDQPDLSADRPFAAYYGLGNWLANRLSVSVRVVNADGGGDAFDVRAVNPRLNGRAAADRTVGDLPEDSSAFTGFTFQNVPPNSTQTLTFTLESKDALDGAVAPVDVSLTFKTPVGPRL